MDERSLQRCLTAPDLVFMGIGAIIGAGVFVMTGVAAATKAGPAISLSYVVAGCAAFFSALAYAELAASIGGCGSAYSYAFSAFGEWIAWMIGWDLLLEYAVSVSTVAIGWSGYLNNLLQTWHIALPTKFLSSPFEGGLFNLPAMVIILLLASLLCLGVKQSSRFNTGVVFIKLAAIAIFISVACFHVQPQYWHPFFPFGWEGMVQGASLVFFAYIGFDALSTAVEETIHPERNTPIGIMGAMVICTLIYIIVALLLTGIVPYSTLNTHSPVAWALLHLGYPMAAGMVAVGAIAGLTTVMLVMYYGLTRIGLAMARDGLLPHLFAMIHPEKRTPIPMILLSGLVIAIIAGLAPLTRVAELVNIGTLAAFTLVSAGTLFLRWKYPDLKRPFKLPFSPVVPVLGVFSCLYLMVHLPLITWLRFIIWMILGIIFYLSYGKKHSHAHYSRIKLG